MVQSTQEKSFLGNYPRSSNFFKISWQTLNNVFWTFVKFSEELLNSVNELPVDKSSKIKSPFIYHFNWSKDKSHNR